MDLENKTKHELIEHINKLELTIKIYERLERILKEVLKNHDVWIKTDFKYIN